MGSSDESRNLGRWRAVSAANGRLAGFVAGSHMQAFQNALAEGSSLPCTQLFQTETAGQMQDGTNSSFGLWQVSYPQIVTVPQQPGAGNLLLMQQNLNAANLWSNNSNPPQMSTEGFPIPFHVMSRHRSPPNMNSNMTEVTNGGISLHLLAPVTPDRVGARRNNKNQSHGLANSLINGSAGVRQHEIFEVSPTVRPNEHINLFTHEHLSHTGQLGPSATIWHFSDPFKETLNLDKESQQSMNQASPSKESHNYEIEKQQTIEPLTPLKQTHYLHKEDHQGIDLNKTPPQKPPRRKKHRPKVITEGKAKKTPQPVTPEQGSQKRGVKSKRDTTPSLNIEGAKGVDHRKRAKSCRRALNFSLEDHPRDDEGRPAAAMCSELPFNPDSKIQDQDTCENASSNSFASLKSTLYGSHGLDITVENSTAGIAFDLNHSLNQMLSGYISLPTNSEHQFASNNSTPIARKELNSSHSSPIAKKAQPKEKFKVLARKKNTPSHVQEAEDCITLPSYSATHSHEWNTLSATYINSKSGFDAKAPCVTQTENRTTCENNKNNGLHPTSLLDSHALSMNTDCEVQDRSVPNLCNKRTSFSQVAPSGNLDKGNRENDKLYNEVKEKYGDIMTKKKRSKLPARVRDLSSVIAYASDPINGITERFKHLSIYEGGKDITMTPGEAHALVPYNGNGQIVSYEGPFDIIKKRRRPRPKVDLDDETNRVWKLLMWKEGEETEIDAEKAKWWEAERQVFKGRVDSFIARMHRVQGDRRFSPWKGSVVDSVIGVFLTQNVSDHLSSSAFMALAARFPLQSKSKNRVNPDVTNKSPEKREDNILYINDCQSKTSNKGVDIEGSLVLHENKIAEEMESACSTGSFGSNMMHSIRDYPRAKEITISKSGQDLNHESLEDKLDTPRLFEEIVLSQGSVVSSSQSTTDSDIQKMKQIGSSFETNAETTNPEWGQKNRILNGSNIPSFMKLLQMQGQGLGDGLVGPDVVYQPKAIEVQLTHDFKAKEVDQIEVSQEESGFYKPTASEITDMMNTSKTEKAKRVGLYDVPHSVVLYSCSEDASISSSCSPPSKQSPQVIGLESGKATKELSEKTDSASLVNHSKSGQKVTGTNFITEKSSYKNGSSETAQLAPKRQKRGADRKKDFDWESLRQETCYKNPRKERPENLRDSLDYEAVRCADASEVSNTIRERGMNNMLTERIKDFLNRLVHEHGSIDLEWLRDVPPDKAKDYLLSIRGLGLKSVECVRLLTLHHLAFPVDTNVGRICVRLGWVPLRPLPESLQLHLLELYPLLESIQKYLWPRLCKLDQHTLYELHYQMITFGKVFCTKSKPNCNACPMRAECRHFASAFASARLALPGPEEKSLVMRDTPLATSVEDHEKAINPMPLPQLEMAPHLQAYSGTTTCEPIIEEPASPEPEPEPKSESVDISESAIEDAFWEEDPDEIPTIKLNIEELSQNVQNYMRENNMQLQAGDLSKALVALTPEAASIPTPKLKNMSRLRTEHHVYELPDSHSLLKGLDQRDLDDPCPYLLAIWTPGETAQSIEPPDMTCSSRASGGLCEKEMCFACNSIREANAQTVRGTLLIPCRTAMRGSFPLNGTYFQVNEVFADHDSSIEPLDVPRALIWNLSRRTVYFGTSIPTIFRGLTTEGIQHCFWRGFVCVRGFDQKTRAPRPLTARLHFPASKLVARKRGPTKQPEE
ncbi:DNA glycosylase/AP lyase ROS1-like isoform X2 [Aristolochia californica]|uniref:DNA glycosylase/AP lyase ROS1-like isoform X2 n=1 Tax=Aristolochia californica TaxID=171875 RepID=UPI0035DCDB1D